MSFDDFLRIWRFMEPFTTEVELTGGEPLLNNDVFDMIAEMAKTDVHITLTTNAQLLNEEIISRIIEEPPTRILIAYDSSDKEKYESTRTRGKLSVLNNNIKLLIKRKNELGHENPMVVLQMVVHKKNQHNIKDFLQAAENMKADAATIKPILVWPGIGKKYEMMMIDKYLIPDNDLSYHRVDKNGSLVKQRKPGVCPNVQQVHIGSGSEVIPCWYILKDTFVAGYASDTPFLEIWYNDEYIEYRRKMIKKTVNKACSGCIGIHDPKLWSIHNLKK
jgi:radical SAM protein with 4Fe4S-binding SPASM domain